MSIQAGTYDAFCEAAYLGRSPKKGTPQIEIQLRLGEDGPSISAYRYFTERGAEYLLKEFEALGWIAAEHDHDYGLLETLKDESGKIMRDSALCGTWCEVVIEPDVYEGKTTMKVKYINKAGGQREEMSDTDRSQFLKNLRKTMVAAAPAAPRSRAPAPSGSAPKSSAPAKPPSPKRETAAAPSALDAALEAGDGPAPTNARKTADDYDFDDIPF